MQVSGVQVCVKVKMPWLKCCALCTWCKFHVIQDQNACDQVLSDRIRLHSMHSTHSFVEFQANAGYIHAAHE